MKGVIDGSSIHPARIEEQAPSTAKSLHCDLHLCVSETSQSLSFSPPPYMLALGIKLRFSSLLQ